MPALCGLYFPCHVKKLPQTAGIEGCSTGSLNNQAPHPARGLAAPPQPHTHYGCSQPADPGGFPSLLFEAVSMCTDSAGLDTEPADFLEDDSLAVQLRLRGQRSVLWDMFALGHHRVISQNPVVVIVREYVHP